VSEIHISISMPLDEGFLRRECPFCHKEFKIQLEEQDLEDLIQKGLDSFMTIQGDEDSEEESDTDSETFYFCPYCGQEASEDSWWTQEQLAYFRVYAKNIMAKLLNENLIRPLKKTFRGQKSDFFSISFKAKEMEQQEPWISPEPNDMEIFELPCCQKKIKIEDNRSKPIHCFFCGFLYKK